MTRYYESSNKLPLGGVLLTLLGELLAGTGLALVCVYATWYLPCIYFNFCFTVLLGGGMGRVMYGQARRGHLRSTGGATGLALLLGI